MDNYIMTTTYGFKDTINIHGVEIKLPVSICKNNRMEFFTCFDEGQDLF